MNKRILILSMAVLLLLSAAGCALGPVNSLPPAGPDAAELVVIRPHAVFGRGIPFDIAVDALDIFALEAGAYTILKVRPGQHTLVARFPNNFPKDARAYTLKINVAVGERLYFTVELDNVWGNEIRTTQLSAAEGEKMMRENEYQPDFKP